MRRQRSTRRRFVGWVGALGAGVLAGCQSDSGDDGTSAPSTTDPSTDTSTATPPETTTSAPRRTDTMAEPEPSTTTRADYVTVSGRLVDESGTGIGDASVGAVAEGNSVSGTLGDEGAFSMEIPVYQEYTVAVGRTPVGLPAVYAVESVETGTDVDLGEVVVPAAYAVDITVESDGRDVTTDSTIRITHSRNDARVTVQAPRPSLELVGNVRIQATYNDSVGSRELTVDSERSITISPS